MSQKQIYIACGLTHVPREIFQTYVGYIHRLGTELRVISRVSDVHYALVDSDPQLACKPASAQAGLCYDWDRRMVEEADLVVADASFPSTGLGIELQIAEAARIPVIMLIGDLGLNRVKEVQYRNPDNSEHELQIGRGFVSLMALGLPNIRKTVQYKEFEEAILEASNAVQLFV